MKFSMMRPAKKESQLATGIDAGGAEIRCLICVHEDGQMRYLGHGSAPSAGWSKGRLADPSEMAAAIRIAVEKAELSAHRLVDSCAVGVGGGTIEGGYCRGVYEFGRPREIGQDEIDFAVRRASGVRLEDDRLLLHVFPQDFVLDGRAGFRNPRRFAATRMEAHVQAITMSSREHEAVKEAIHQAHLEVEETVFSPVAAAYASVLPEDRARGVALVDIGLHSTGLVVYDGDALMLATTLPISADHFTRDISYVFKISHEDAEKLKIECGCAMLGLTADNSLIEVPSAEGRPAREARRRELNEILDARAEELFLYVRHEIQRAGMDQNLLEGVVLSGGGSMLSGMCDMAERVLNCLSRKGLPTGIRNLPADLETPQWTTAAGLSMYAARLKLRKEKKKRAPGLVGMVWK